MDVGKGGGNIADAGIGIGERSVIVADGTVIGIVNESEK